ncbi:TPA: glycosyltransferase family 4 protein, partial [Escherichia coli O146:H28]|nr:glycosyltransferase family 4 protein [Escherichia coli O146:H28]
FMKIKNRFMNIDVVYTNTSDNYMGLLLSIFLKKKNIFHIREFGLEDQHQKHIITDHLYYSLVNKYANEVIVISEALKNKIIKYITGNNLNLIYDDVHIQNKPMLNYANSARLRKFIIIGTLCEGKGQKIAIEAMHNLIREGYLCHLKIIGNNRVPYASYLNKIVADYNLSDYVEFMGFRHDLDQIRLDNDVCLIPSLSEAFGRVTIESMAAGMIVVASDSGASKEIINDGINGFLFSSGSVSDLTSVLKKILDVESNNLECIRKRALVDSQKYTSGHAASSIYNLIIN